MKTIFATFRQKQLRTSALIAAAAMAAGFLTAQSPAPRILAEVENSQPTVLKGSMQPLNGARVDAGRMPADHKLSGISIYFKRSAAQEADLKTLLAAQQNPASPQFHNWLNPDQFAARFGMAPSDLEKVQSWLQQQGFSIDSVARSHNMIRFSGTVGQVEQAFSTEMHYYQGEGVKHFAPSTELSLPAAIASTVESVHNLSDFRPRPMHFLAKTAHARGAYTTGGTSTSNQSVVFAPGDIATVYDIKPLTTGGNTGTGQTIAIMGQSAISNTDIEHFQSNSGLTVKDPTSVLVPDTGTSTEYADGDEGESDLDLEWSGATAPGANIAFVYTGGNGTNNGVFDSLGYAIDEKIGDILSISYGVCEPLLGSFNQDSLYEQAAAQGQSIIAASGDQGATACSGDTAASTTVQEELAVNYPASSAYVTGVGGTEITSADDGVGTYWLAAATTGSSPGADVLNSAVKYIPEVAWNDDAFDVQYGGGISASTGGTSTLYTTKPTWQTGVTGIPADGKRDVPDVALYASPNFPGYLFCTSDTSDWQPASTGYPAQAGSCNDGFYDQNAIYLTVAGGTSFATPIFAGMMALINEKAGYTTGQGFLNPELYTLASNSTTYASAFHDVTSGNNDCAAGSTYCSSSSTGFSAGTGYDQVTGLGSVDVANLATAWPVNSASSAALIGTTTTLAASNTAPAVGASVTFTITVAPVSGTGVPAGTINLSIDGGGTSYSNGGTTATATLTANGTATYTTSFSTAGPHAVVAQYAGNTTYAASTGTASVTIAASSSGKGTISVAATPSTLTVSQGSSGTETVTVTPASGYTGTVLLNVDFGSSGDNSLQNLCGGFSGANSQGLGTVAISGTAAAASTLTLDTNASDCATAAAQARTHTRPLRSLIAGQTAKNTRTGNPLPAGIAFASLLLLGYFGRQSRKLRNLAAVLALVAAGLVVSACGSSSTTATTVSNPPKGSYTGTISAQDSVTSTISATTTFTFTIN